MLHHFVLTIAFFFFTLFQTHAQSLELVQYNKTKFIHPGTYLQIETPKPYACPRKNCQLNTMTGRLISVSNDSISLRLLESMEYLPEEEKGIAYKKFIPAGEGPIRVVAKSDILSVVVKGKRKFHRNHLGDAIGIVVASLAIYDLGVEAVDDDYAYYGYYGSRTGHKLAMGALVASGIVMILSKQPHYITSKESDYKRNIRKIWVVE